MRRWSQIVAVVAVLATLTTSASAQTPSLEQQLDERAAERSRTEQRLAETKDAEADARERLAEADRQLARVTAELAAVEEALAAATAERDRARAEVRRVRAELGEVEAELAEAEADLEVAKARLGARAAGAYKRGASATETAIVGQFLAAEDIGAALATTPFLTAVLDADRRIVDDVQELLGTVQRQRSAIAALRVVAERETRTAEAQADEVARRVREQRELTAEVATRRAEQDAALEALAEDRSALESHLDGLEAESAKLADQLAAIAAEQAAAAERAAQAEREARAAREEEARRRAEREAAAADPPSSEDGGSDGGDSEGGGSDGGGSDGGGSDGGSEAVDDPGDDGDVAAPPPAATGGWLRPVGGAMTSPFGPRWGRNHNGVDLAGSVGTNVVSSRAGVVVSVTTGCHATSSFGCGGGFGNHVVISHDGGMGTIYAHLSSVAVGSGQSVAGGQSIGAVGNSGNSYGAHLHFEVREAGTPRNPCNYIAC